MVRIFFLLAPWPPKICSFESMSKTTPRNLEIFSQSIKNLTFFEIFKKIYFANLSVLPCRIKRWIFQLGLPVFAEMLILSSNLLSNVNIRIWEKNIFDFFWDDCKHFFLIFLVFFRNYRIFIQFLNIFIVLSPLYWYPSTSTFFGYGWCMMLR